MKYKELICKYKEKTNISFKKSKSIIDSLFETISDNISATEKLHIKNFGSFGIKHIPTKKGFNPKTLESITINELNRIKFIPSNCLKSKIN